MTGEIPGTPQPPVSPEELAPHFPQIEILECLGRGGMGVVYKARQKSLNRLVALKLLAPERVTDARFAERFTREAHALAALNHPHIVTVYDFGQAGGYYFLLMEFVDGVNLRQLLQAKKLTQEEALAIIPPLCDALQYAHEHGIVHRDIKPANLLLDKSGRVKIADFGIAKMVGDNSSIGLTESQPVGTPQYMAPEQKEHRVTDHRADIYSLGVVLYEMLTGELPTDKLQTPSRKVQIDVRLDTIVLRALEKTPELRYQTAVELRTQVETLVAENGFVPKRGSARKVVLRVIGVLLFVLGVIVIFALVSWRHLRTAEASQSAEVLQQKIKQQNGKSDPSAASNLEEEIIRLARKRLDQARQSYEAKQVSLSEVEEAEGELALAEARGDQLKRAEARLTMATKYLERIENLFRTGNIGEAEYNHAKQRKLEAQLEKADALRNAGQATSGRNTEDEMIRLARERLDQTRQLYRTQHVSLSQVDEAEGELAVAEARGDLLKRAEARLTIATKYLERIEGVRRAGNISDAEYNQAKQRKLEAELELQRARTAAFPKTEKNSGAAVITRNFALHHRLASETSDDLRQILSGKPGHEAKPSADNQELLVTAPPDVMTRVQTFITVNDWPDAITRGSDFRYPNNSVTRTARSFFYACAIEDWVEAFSKQLSSGVLAELKGDAKGKEFQNYQMGGVPDADWEKSLRADWPGRKEAIQRLVREWNRYPLKRLTEDPGIAIGFGIKHFCSVSFEGAPKPFYQITIEPDRTKPYHDGEPLFLFSSLPPWWGVDPVKLSNNSKPAKSPTEAVNGTSAVLNLSYQQFDQTPHSGWRVLAQDEKRFREAAALIEAYLLHDGLDSDERVNLHFHAAQCLAFAGDAKSVLDALGHMKQARHAAEPPDAPLRWNDYVGATEAFLKGDLDALKAARERIAAGPKPNGVSANLDVVDRLIARFGQPYRQAYLSEPGDAGRTSDAPVK